MYWFMSVDALIRIAFAMAFLFVIVPALSGLKPAGTFALERFFWNFGVGITLLTLIGQLLTLANLFSLFPLLVVTCVVILLGRAIDSGRSPWSIVREAAQTSFLAALNIFDRRVNVPRRIRRKYRRTIAALREKTQSPVVRLQIAGWTALTSIAAALRLYRPLVSANLGFSDTYVHLYLVKLLEEGRQVDPNWGPYPRGMHFLLLAIHELTNVDESLLMNFFGVFIGVLMTLAVADAVRRLSKSLAAGLLAGFLFATLIGGPSQYFVLGGVFGTNDESLAKSLTHLPYADLVRTAGEFDLALTAFQRQTSTLPQEVAIVLLFPASLFLLEYFRRRERWHLVGFTGCTAAIAALHSGVLAPLVLMSALMLIAAAIQGTILPGTIRDTVVGGFLAVVIGSSWMLGFIMYPYSGGKGGLAPETSVPGTALYYFPFLRAFMPDQAGPAKDIRVFVMLTPFLTFAIILAIALLILSVIRRDGLRANRIWVAAVFLLFLFMHFASMLRLPELVETKRNSQWLLMSMIVLSGIAIAEVAALRRVLLTQRAATVAASIASIVLLAGWTSRVPRLSEPAVHDRIVNYSGYGGSALAVLRIQRSLEPYTWTIVSYGQEFPMVLRRGFHLPAADFLDRYDPATAVVPIPTPDIFIIVEKTPHQFEINTWAQRYNRADLEQRLQTWVLLYQATHNNLRIFLEDENVRVYQIRRTAAEIEKASRSARQ